MLLSREVRRPGGDPFIGAPDQQGSVGPYAGVRIEPSTSSARAEGQWFESSANACKAFEASQMTDWPSVRIQSPATQTHYPTAKTKKTCKCRSSRERLKGFEPSTFCMASRTCSTGFPRFIPANRQFLGHWALAAIARYSTRDHGSLCTECVPGGWARPQTRPADGAEPGCRRRRHRHHPAFARARAAELSCSPRR